MAGVPGTKRARVEEVKVKNDDHDESDEDSEEDEEMEEQEVAIIKDDFEFAVRKPESVDYDGIRQLLAQMFLKLQVNLAEMTDWIIVHNNVGSFLHQCFPELDEEDANGEGKEKDEDDMDDDDSSEGQFPVLNIVTVINVTEKPDVEFAAQLRKELVERCRSNCRDEFQDILSNPANRVALLINERYVNLPPQLCLMENLWKEIELEKQNDEDYRFTHYLVISKVDRLTKLTKRKQTAAPPQPERCFRNAEEEIFYKNALLSFEFSVKDQSDSALCGAWNDDSGPYEPFRTVMIVAADKIPTIMSEMTALMAENGIEQGMQN